MPRPTRWSERLTRPPRTALVHKARAQLFLSDAHGAGWCTGAVGHKFLICVQGAAVACHALSEGEESWQSAVWSNHVDQAWTVWLPRQQAATAAHAHSSRGRPLLRPAASKAKASPLGAPKPTVGRTAAVDRGRALGLRVLPGLQRDATGAAVPAEMLVGLAVCVLRSCSADGVLMGWLVGRACRCAG
jgi:hypothetical protein